MKVTGKRRGASLGRATVTETPLNGDESIAMMQQQPSTSSMKTPLHLPPKSPKSLSGNFLFGTTNKPTKPRRGRSKERQSDATTDSSSSALLSGEALVDESLEDPSPDHFHIFADSDDLSTTTDFSMVSFEKVPSSTDPLRNIDWNTRRSLHRRARSWDSSYAYQESRKAYLVVPSFFRRQKVQCANVTTMSYASDTVVSEEENGRITGRELHEAAKAVLNSGDYEQAVSMFETLQNAQSKRFGEEHSSVAAAMHNVGVVRLRMGAYNAAEDVLVQAVRIRRKVLGNDHLDLAASLGKLGSAQVVLRKFDDAHENLREAIRIIRKTLGRCHKTMAQLLSMLACLYFEVGELFSAQATFEDAVDIYREVFPTESDRDACMLQMTEAMCNTGSIQNKRKNFTEATHSFTQALALQRGIMGHDNPRVIASLDNLGYSYSKNKSYNRALSCFKEMLSAQLSRYGAFTPECCETLKKQIVIYEKLKDLNGAIKATKKALDKVSALPTSDDCIAEIQRIRSGLKRKRKNQKYCNSRSAHYLH